MEKTGTIEITADESGKTPAVTKVPKKPKAHRVSKKTGMNVTSEKVDNFETVDNPSGSASQSQTESSLQIVEQSSTVSGFIPETQEASQGLESSTSKSFEAKQQRELSGAMERVSTNVTVLGVI